MTIIISVSILVSGNGSFHNTALEFQHFFASAFPRQCFCRSWQDFILRASAFTSATSVKTSTKSKLVRLLPLHHVLPRIRSIMCTVIVVQILLYKYCYMQCNVLFSHVKNCVLKILLNALFEFKKTNMKETCSVD